MKIETNEVTHPLDAIPNGECFHTAGSVWLKCYTQMSTLRGLVGKCLCVDLGDGEVRMMSADVTVSRAPAKVVLE